jgi:hypothetical protein
MQQVGHQVRAPLRLGAARVGQDGGHLGVGQARMRADQYVESCTTRRD